MTKLLARLRYDGQHHRCRAPRCLRVARHRVGTCSPAPSVVKLAAEKPVWAGVDGECGCPVRFAPEVRGDAVDTLIEHTSTCPTTAVVELVADGAR